MGKLSSLSSTSGLSDAVQVHLMQMIDGDEEENYKEDENIEPELPSCLNLKSLVFKNPFGRA